MHSSRLNYSLTLLLLNALCGTSSFAQVKKVIHLHKKINNEQIGRFRFSLLRSDILYWNSPNLGHPYIGIGQKNSANPYQIHLNKSKGKHMRLHRFIFPFNSYPTTQGCQLNSRELFKI